MVLKYAFFVCLASTFQIALSQDYCNTYLCGGRRHIACNNNGAFAASCNNARVVPMTQAIINVILRSHNNKRNIVAGGNNKLGAACRMATMQWNNQLANMAALNVKQCQMKHDACRNTAAFPKSGQNLALIGFNGQLKAQNSALRAINLWYNEIANTKMSQINSFPRNYAGAPIGHFTAMMRDQSNYVGCAIVSYQQAGKRFKSFLMACNYASTNIVNSPVYATCATAASRCMTGKNPAFTNLCSLNERYN